MGILRTVPVFCSSDGESVPGFSFQMSFQIAVIFSDWLTDWFLILNTSDIWSQVSVWLTERGVRKKWSYISWEGKT